MIDHDCLKLSGGTISIYFEIWGRNCGGPEVASDLVQLSLLKVLHPASISKWTGDVSAHFITLMPVNWSSDAWRCGYFSDGLNNIWF